ncbi:hypothetical protein GCM10007973_18360 [Polymorphobacter multimanifer]|uniref:hypothetical protein n=1 Tax=Polymorphobacter multimanifer TaxID=1070431 RepID=UPI0016695C69|nr:hypothetical protein [Polymorphobacter multimanifer]GGI82225.1 hypothetical protein GCM10007973_18360 [Polymorphobacter multimanifer]
MSEVSVTAPGAGTPLRFNFVGGVNLSVAKLAFGDADTATLVQTGSGLPVAVQGTVPVSGPLTDAQARATPLPVAVPGSVAVTGPATDTQLRATPPPVLVSGVATAAAQATGNTPLASIDGKTPALAGGRVPVVLDAVPRLATTTRAYADSVRIVTAGTAAVRTTLGIAATEVTLCATVDGFYAIGSGSVVAANAAGSFPVAAFVPFSEQITSGQFISFIRAGSTDGALFIKPVA